MSHPGRLLMSGDLACLARVAKEQTRLPPLLPLSSRTTIQPTQQPPQPTPKFTRTHLAVAPRRAMSAEEGQESSQEAESQLGAPIPLARLEVWASTPLLRCPNANRRAIRATVSLLEISRLSLKLAITLSSRLRTRMLSSAQVLPAGD